MPVVIMSVGLPGSGKTTYLKSLYKLSSNCSYLCADDVRAEIYGDASVQADPARVWGEVHSRLQANLEIGKDVIVDGTLVKRADRRSLITKCLVRQDSIKPDDQVELICLHFTTPLEQCLRWNQSRERQVPEHAIHRMARQMERTPPEKWEGFQGVIPVDSTKISLEKIRW